MIIKSVKEIHQKLKKLKTDLPDVGVCVAEKAMGEVINLMTKEDTALASFSFRRTVEAAIGAKMQERRSDMMQFIQDLAAKGKISEAQALEYRDGEGKCWLAKNTNKEKLVVFKRHEFSFVIMIRNEYADYENHSHPDLAARFTGGWEMHLRQLWPEFTTKEMQGITIASEKDAIANIEILSRFSDESPQNTYPQRPSLKSFLKKPKASRAFKYQDGRDAGYLYSTAFGPSIFPEYPEKNAGDLSDIFKLDYALQTFDNCICELEMV